MGTVPRPGPTCGQPKPTGTAGHSLRTVTFGLSARSPLEPFGAHLVVTHIVQQIIRYISDRIIVVYPTGVAGFQPRPHPLIRPLPALTASGRAGRLTTSCGVTTPATQAAAMALPLTDREREIAILISQGLVQHRHRPSPNPVGPHHRRPHLPRLCAGGCGHQKRTRPAHHGIRADTWLLTTLTDRFDGRPTPPENQQPRSNLKADNRIRVE
jgi:hypothetical protein